jgi:hypothetical protein
VTVYHTICLLFVWEHIFLNKERSLKKMKWNKISVLSGNWIDLHTIWFIFLHDLLIYNSNICLSIYLPFTLMEHKVNTVVGKPIQSLHSYFGVSVAIILHEKVARNYITIQTFNSLTCLYKYTTWTLNLFKSDSQ